VRILFVCGGLEVGRDGVGDYTRRLALELVNQGCSASMLALNDPHLVGNQTSLSNDGDSVNSLRLSSNSPWSKRLALARSFVQSEDPDYLSLQFVPFSFDPRGLCGRLAADLKDIGGGRPWHVMCHELWIDSAFPLPLKHRFLGLLQRPQVRKLMHRLGPRLVHTQLAYYQRMLAGIGVQSDLLPLHGNIPVASNREEGRHWLAGKIGASPDDFVAGFFGDILPTIDERCLERYVAQASESQGRLWLLSAGRLSSGGASRWKLVEAVCAGRASVKALGPLPEEDVTRYLSALDEGLTGYPPELAGKSGAVASMVEHGLAVRPLGRFYRGSSDLCHDLITEAPSGRSVSRTARRLQEALAR